MKTQRLYLRSWEYNIALTLQELRKIIANNGGELVKSYDDEKKYFEITNRTLSGAIEETEEHHQKIKNRGRTVAPEAVRELEEMKAINNEPVLIDDSLLYLSFIIDDVYYSLDINDNPFFPFHYSKVAINEYAYKGDFYREEFSKDWVYDCLFSYKCNHEERKEIANLIFNELMKAPKSKEHIERKKTARF